MMWCILFVAAVADEPVLLVSGATGAGSKHGGGFRALARAQAPSPRRLEQAPARAPSTAQTPPQIMSAGFEKLHVSTAEWGRIADEHAQARAERSASQCERVAWSRERRQPDVAFCIAGAARQMTVPIVERLLHRYLFDAFGASSDSRAFFAVKAADSWKMFPDHHIQEAASTEIDAIEDFLHAEWLKPILAEAIIVNGSGVSLEIGQDWNASSHVVSADANLWKRYRAVDCATESGEQEGCCTFTDYLKSNGNEHRLLLNHVQLSWCADAIEREEVRRRGRKFDLVVFARPDLIWHWPVAPWCLWQHRRAPVKRFQMFSTPTLGADFFWGVERQFMRTLFGQAALHRDCEQKDWVTLNRPGYGPGTIAPHCCSYSEALLTYAKSVAQGERSSEPLTWWNWDQPLNLSAPGRHMFRKYGVAPIEHQCHLQSGPSLAEDIFGDRFDDAARAQACVLLLTERRPAKRPSS